MITRKMFMIYGSVTFTLNNVGYYIHSSNNIIVLRSVRGTQKQALERSKSCHALADHKLPVFER